VASATAADGGLLEVAALVVVVCGSGHRDAASSRGQGVLSGGRPHEQRPNRPEASVGHERARERVCPLWLWAAPGGRHAPMGHDRIPVGCEIVRRQDQPRYRSDHALGRRMLVRFRRPRWAEMVVVVGDAVFASKANMQLISHRGTSL
jgi:hypothetical protein